MNVKQLSVFVENKVGRLAEITGYLAEERINIHALSIADTTDFGILRLIVANPDQAFEVLKEKGLTVKMTDVVALALEDRPGGLSSILKQLDTSNVSIEYMYAFTSRHSEYGAMVILRLANQLKAVELLKNSGVTMLNADVIRLLD